MKTIHKRLYTAIPRSLASSSSSSAPANPSRVRSNSACSSRSLYTASSSTLPFSFFDTPAPPPSSRPGSTNLVASTRLAGEVKAETEPHSNSPYSNNGQPNTPQAQSQNSGPPPYPLAFSSGQSDASRLPPSTHYNLFFPYPSFGPASSWHSTASSGYDASHPSKRQRTRYHLDVGAYGIPKRSHGSRVAGREGRTPRLFTGDSSTMNGETSAQAVQVGEDAYFVRDNAMGVADGVGGWSKVRQPGRPDDPTPSALFARRLMHYCCEEVDAAMARPGLSDSSAGLIGERETLHDQLEDSLEDLADGLDVLMILEKAFEKTIKAHVVSQIGGGETNPASRPREGASAASNRSSQDSFTNATETSSTPPSSSSASHASQRGQACPVHASGEPVTASTVPLMEGSSTALLAILEHPRIPSPKVSKPRPLFNPHPRHAEAAPAPVADRGAVIRIAHLGDCMAMLIRGEEIVWRTEEMWWNFNTPVQLGPTSSTKPQDAHIYTVPVVADDILILASDGLSDNLWDEDILDEVVRFRQSFLSNADVREAPSKGEAMSLRRSSLAGMLSEALCSRARCVSERRGSHGRKGAMSPSVTMEPTAEDDIPFGRRAREHGKLFHGGKPDDISVLVAVVSPVE